MPASIIEAMDQLRLLLAGFDPGVYSGDDCVRLVEGFAATEKACAGARMLAANRAVECRSHEKKGFADGANWLARQSGITPGEAKRTLKTAGKMGERTKDALLEGKLSLDQAEEITNTADEVPGSEGELVDLASETDLSQLREETRGRRLAAIKREELHERQRRARTFRSWRDELGMVCFKGALPPETGLPFVRRVELEAYRLRRTAKQDSDTEVEGSDAYAADALVAMFQNAGDSKRSPNVELAIVCDIRAWRRGHPHEGEPCHIVDGAPIPVDLAKQLATDAFLKALLHDGVKVSHVKHFGRHIPAEIRTALDLGDPPDFTGAVCEDCGKRHHLEYDHVDPFSNGGPTSVDNLKPRCWTDHHAKTERDRRAGLLKPQRKSGPDPRPPP
jgi:5-methylcytosine-specific restriction endonuclease McrA